MFRRLAPLAVTILSLVGAGALAVPAALGESVAAGPAATAHDAFSAASYTIDQGQTLTFSNRDSDLHNVTATAMLNGRPLFVSKNVQTGQVGVVGATQYLRSGRYQFICTLHSFMTATLVVTAAGRPLLRPRVKARKRGCRSRRHRRCGRSRQAA